MVSHDNKAWPMKTTEAEIEHKGNGLMETTSRQQELAFLLALKCHQDKDSRCSGFRLFSEPIVFLE